MADLAGEIMSYVKLKDRLSRLELSTCVFSTPEIYKVLAPIENGSIVFKVAYFASQAAVDRNEAVSELTYTRENFST